MAKALRSAPIVRAAGAGQEEPSGLSPRQRRAVLAYVALLQKALRLQSWTVRVDFDSFAEDALADMTNSPHQRWATLRLGSGFADLPAMVRTQTLVHELVHCHLFELHDTVSDVLEVGLSRKACAVAAVAVGGQVELVTDALADVLVALLPPLELPAA